MFSDVNAAYVRAARSVLFHDEALLQRFRLTVKLPSKQTKSRQNSKGKYRTALTLNSVKLKFEGNVR